jgi:hypothetical protein
VNTDTNFEVFTDVVTGENPNEAAVSETSIDSEDSTTAELEKK